MKYCLFGAAPDTGNLGVSALCFSTLAAIFCYDSRAKVTVFDYGRGNREEVVRANGREFRYTRCGGFDTRRLYRRESLWNIRTSARFGGLGSPGAAAMISADAVLDISGGDSFTDLYGPRRFWAVTLPKLIALELGRPLVLLPQTYGPFDSPRLRRIAERVVRGATMAWARDARSFDVLHSLAGPEFNPDRHRNGVDVAFALEPREPEKPLPDAVNAWVRSADGSRVAINVSGLTYNDPEGASRRYGFKADYRYVVDRLLRRFLNETEAQILLVPHVLSPPGHYESDIAACEVAMQTLGPAGGGRIAIVPALYDQSETKWLIGHANWFCGTRMHAAIAALSSRVPTAALAYSVKTAGVFKTCGQDEHVADLRTSESAQVIERLWNSWLTRSQALCRLNDIIPSVCMKARDEIDDIIRALARVQSNRGIGR